MTKHHRVRAGIVGVVTFVVLLSLLILPFRHYWPVYGAALAVLAALVVGIVAFVGTDRYLSTSLAETRDPEQARQESADVLEAMTRQSDTKP